MEEVMEFLTLKNLNSIKLRRKRYVPHYYKGCVLSAYSCCNSAKTLIFILPAKQSITRKTARHRLLKNIQMFQRQTPRQWSSEYESSWSETSEWRVHHPTVSLWPALSSVCQVRCKMHCRLITSRWATRSPVSLQQTLKTTSVKTSAGTRPVGPERIDGLQCC